MSSDPRSSLIETTRKNNVSHNLFQILSKYIEVDQFLQGITGIVHKVNNYWNEDKIGSKSSSHGQQIIEKQSPAE